MTRAEKFAKFITDGKWGEEHESTNDYGELVYNFCRGEGEWLKAIYRVDAIEVYSSENSKSVFFRDDPKPETRAEKIKRLSKTDVHFVGFVSLLHRLQQERRDLLNAERTLRNLGIIGIQIPENFEAANELYHKKEDAIDYAIEEIYGISWHGHKEAFKVCGLE